MRISNYQNELWPLVYDQYSTERHEKELTFYLSELRNTAGPVLEAACGTGMILLKLMEVGCDAYGFDVAGPMLEVLFSKAAAKAVPDIRARVTTQGLVNFRYQSRFEAICIPARSFLHLLTQPEQIQCLRNVFQHLKPGGRLLLNFFNPDLAALVAGSASPADYRPFRTFEHQTDKRPIHVAYRQRNDLLEQVLRSLLLARRLEPGAGRVGEFEGGRPVLPLADLVLGAGGIFTTRANAREALGRRVGTRPATAAAQRVRAQTPTLRDGGQGRARKGENGSCACGGRLSAAPAGRSRTGLPWAARGVPLVAGFTPLVPVGSLPAQSALRAAPR